MPASLFDAPLCSGLSKEALLKLHKPSEQKIAAHARRLGKERSEELTLSSEPNQSAAVAPLLVVCRKTFKIVPFIQGGNGRDALY
jgi:hypothetical protein